MNSFLDSIGKLFGGSTPQQLISPLPRPAQGSGAVFTSPQGGNVYPANFTGPLGPQDYRIGQNNATTSGVLGASTTTAARAGGGTTGGSAAPAASSSSLQDVVNRQRQDQLNSANSSFDQYAGTLRNQLGDLGNQKTSLLDQIGATYSNVRQQAQDTLAKNVGALEQGKGTVKQGYADLRTEQSRLLGDTQLRNRQIARALGDLNSGFYENTQSKAAGNTQSNISKIGQQEQSQLDQIGQEIVNQNTDANTKLQGLNETEASAKTDVLNKYQSAYNQINSLLSGNDRGRLDAIQAINNQAQSALDNITQTMASYRSAASGLGGISNPIKSAQDQVSLLSSINKSGLIPVSQQYPDAYNKATSLLQSGQATLDQVVGYLKGIDPRLAAEFQLSTQQNGTTGGLNLPILGNIGGRPSYTTSVPQSSSLLDQLFRR